jgi:hypothetical protein
MDDLDLDRALERAFAVDPSPEFVARVRTNIADTTPSPFTGWLKPAAAIGCVVALAIAAGLTRHEDAPKQARVTPSTTNVPRTINAAAATTALSTATAAAVVPTPRSARTAVPRTSLEPPLPEVIIAPEDVDGLRQFVASASEVRFVVSFDQTPPPVPWVTADQAELNN